MKRVVASLLACALAVSPSAATAEGNAKVVQDTGKEPARREQPAPWWTRDDLGPPKTGPYAGMFNETLGETAGLALHGVGEGAASAPATAIRMGDVATIGHGEGVADLDRVDNSHNRVAGSYTMRILPKEMAADYQLAPASIQRIIRLNFGRFKVCYDAGLRLDPTLAGRVAVKFAIDRAGTVVMAADRGSDLPDADVVSCIVRGFANLAFPPSPDGYATVVYALVLTPGE
jgi:hypothetical protein